MASISKIDGKWRALIRRAGYPEQSKRFPTKAAAVAWAASIEDQIRECRTAPITSELTIAELVTRYRKLRDSSRPIADTSNEHYELSALSRLLGTEKAAYLTIDRLTEWAKVRRDEGAGPYTINMDLSKLGTVYKYGGMGLNLPDIVGQARPMLSHLGLIGAGGKRQRRPTQDELERILDKASPMMNCIIRFAVATAMRRGEIARVKWADFDEQRKMLWIRDRKDPRNKAGNDEEIPLLPAAMKVMMERKALREEGEPRIFPVHVQSISDAFLDITRALNIPDLHFHDMRHEGTSALIEAGYPIQEVALVTGHKSWNTLKRYANLKPESLHQRVVGQDK